MPDESVSVTLLDDFCYPSFFFSFIFLHLTIPVYMCLFGQSCLFFSRLPASIPRPPQIRHVCVC
jgi:hypothetical protein